MMHNNAYDADTYSGEQVMRTTLIIEDDLIEKASMLTGVKEKTSLVRMGLEALIASESGR